MARTLETAVFLVNFYGFLKKYGIITVSRKLVIMYLLLKYWQIFLLVLKLFDEPLGELNTEIRVKVFIYY